MDIIVENEKLYLSMQTIEDVLYAFQEEAEKSDKPASDAIFKVRLALREVFKICAAEAGVELTVTPRKNETGTLSATKSV